MESPQVREFMVFPVHGVLWSHGCRTFAMDVFSPNSFVHPTISLRMLSLKAFSGIFQSYSSEHNPGMSKHGWNQGGNFLWIFDFAAQIWVRISWKTVPFLPCPKRYQCPFFPVRKDISALSSLSKKIHAKSMPPKNPKVYANFKRFSQWFLWAFDPGMRRCFWMPIFHVQCRSTKIVN